MKIDQSIIDAAIEGCHLRIEKAQAMIVELTALRNGRGAPTTKPRKKRRRMSAEGRKRIAEAQKARWAAKKKTQK